MPTTVLARSPGFARCVRGLSLVVLALTASACRVADRPAQGPMRPDRDVGSARVGATAVQALVGGVVYDDLEFSRADPGNPNDVADVDLSTMPALGIAGHYAIVEKGGFEAGLDGGVVVSWDGDRAVLANGSGQAIVVIDRDLAFYDLFMGAYASTLLGDTVRLYAAAGPNALIGDADYRDELRRDSDTAVGFGAYARGGLEFRLPDGALFGVGARWLTTEIDFDDPIGDLDIDGVQVFITYTVGM